MGQRLLAWLVVFLLAPAAPGAEVCLVADGAPRAVLVTAETPTRTAAYAAQELARHVRLATGAQLKVVTERRLAAAAPRRDFPTRVFVGATRAAAEQGMDAGRLGREAFLVRTVGPDVYIVGREDDGDPLAPENPNVGPLWGVYDLLERELGVRWLWPGPLGVYVPRTSAIRLEPIDRTGAPALTFRELAWSRIRRIAEGRARLEPLDARLGFDQDVARQYGQALAVFLRRHRMGGMDAKPPTGHRFRGWWARYGREHPEWFALRKDGTRGHPDPDYPDVPLCVTNEELQDFIVQQWDGESTLLLGPVDRPGRCACDRCLAWDGPQPEQPPWFAQMVYRTDPRAQQLFAGATADRYARFWKTILEKAARRNPNVLVSASFLYENEFPAPARDIQLGPQIYAEFVQWQDPHLRWFPMPDEAFRWIQQQWLGWKRTGIRMGYRPNYLHDGYVMPHLETWQSGRFFQFAHRHGMEGARFDSLTGQWAVHGLRLYMHLRLLAHPDLPLARIRREYFAAFGPAADDVAAYWAYWENYANRNMMRFLDLFRNVGFRYRAYPLRAHEAFPPACFEPAEAMLARALAAARGAASPEYAERVRFLQIGLEHARLTVRFAALMDGRSQPPPERADAARRALDELVRFRKTHQRTYFSDLSWVTNYWERPQWNLDDLLN